MLHHRPFETLGSADHGWLKARHHFSFADYYDPHKMSHGELLVINDDRIASQTGFASHPHRDMEIITYVRAGAITHQDDQGNTGRTCAGSIQVMSAGTGIVHSEYNYENTETSIYQIWIQPAKQGVTPRWDMADFPTSPVITDLPLLVSGDGRAPLQIHQDARIFGGRLNQGAQINHVITGKAYLLISQGKILVNDQVTQKGDGVAISDEVSVMLTAQTDSELLMIEVPGWSDAR